MGLDRQIKEINATFLSFFSAHVPRKVTLTLFILRQYNFLVWKPGEYEELAKRLQNRIEATLGRGPVKSS